MRLRRRPLPADLKGLRLERAQELAKQLLSEPEDRNLRRNLLETVRLYRPGPYDRFGGPEQGVTFNDGDVAVEAWLRWAAIEAGAGA